MADSFIQNLRKVQVPYKAGKEPARVVLANSGIASSPSRKWDFDAINKVLNDRFAGNDKSESPFFDFDVEIPKTLNVRKIQTGRYKLDNDINKSGINNSNALYVVGNTYQENKDGTNYGMGWDGRPYSYTIRGDVVGNFTPLGIDEQYKAIERLSGGKIKAYDSIDNPGTLAEIYRSIKRMQEHGNGNLVPDEVNIGDPEPGNVIVFGPGSATLGWYNDNNQYVGEPFRPDEIALAGSSYPDIQTERISEGIKSGHNAGNLAHAGDNVSTHELAHAAESAYLFGDSRYKEKKAEEAEKYAGIYSAEDLLKQGVGKTAAAISGIKYAIPLLFDSLFGTHLVPTKEEYNKMPDGIASRFWADYIYPPEHEIKDLKAKKLKEAYDTYTEWDNEMLREDEGQYDLFEKAAKNTGFDSIANATASISQYATSNYTEAFAEAYTDVLLNGDKAKPFSQELIRLYSDAADKYTKKYKNSKKKPIQGEMLNELFDVLPLNKISKDKPDFIQIIRGVASK